HPSGPQGRLSREVFVRSQRNLHKCPARFLMFSMWSNVSGRIMAKELSAGGRRRGARLKTKRPPRRTGRPCKMVTSVGRGGLEPAFFAGDVGGHEVLVGLGQVDDAFDQADDAGDEGAETEGEHADEQHDDALLGVTENELMDAKAS